LPGRLRHAAALSALTAVGDWDGFESQARWALQARSPIAWLREAMLQSYLFVGYPRAIEALKILSRITHGGTDRFLTEISGGSRRWPARGEALCRAIYGSRYPALIQVMRGIHPDLAVWMVTEGYGKVLSRPFLTPREREICVIPILAAQGSWPQLASHLDGALRVGARRREAEEALETGMRFSPRARSRKARGEWSRLLLRSAR
jgi:4-carboxymuconolactone decarboxylase